jgi:hypothetical protein
MEREELFVVVAYSNSGKRSYVVGVFDNAPDAEDAADDEEDYRRGEYKCVISEHKLNAY